MEFVSRGVVTPIIYQRSRCVGCGISFVRNVGTRIAFGQLKLLSRIGREKTSGALLAVPPSNSGMAQYRMIRSHQEKPLPSFSSGHSLLADGGELM